MRQSADQAPFQLPEDKGTAFENDTVIDFRTASEHLKKTEPQVIAERVEREKIDAVDSESELQPLTPEQAVEVRGKVLQFFRREELEQSPYRQDEAA